MCVSIGNLTLRDPVLLAPMAGITDLPFRRQVARFGVGMMVSEMIASREIAAGDARARAKAEIEGGLGLTSVQIAGREPHWVAEAARLAEGMGAPVIDINMGCPAKKVTGGLSGSALMRVPDLALSLIEAAAEAVSVPVTLKMRLGWDATTRNAPDIARRAEAAGVAMITVHGRDRCQFYEGAADWAAVGETVRAVRVPVIVNGDIADADDARAALRASGAAGVMVGRAARGKPWLPARIAAGLAGRRPPAEPDPETQTELVCAHYEDMLSFYGTEVGRRCARKHLGWRLDHAPGATPLIARLMREESPARVLRALRAELPGLLAAAAAPTDPRAIEDAA
ncbi:MAG: tRNA dihydrouridine synthase DusB [Pseudomonadota bacterium]|nr:tRNA dihydrouridine synthase DusB [Pseudomonadota bacterium]MEE3100715.1 tRNA dihydrouridine synthase DusB [Pseudomonadota bacterium]